MLSALISSLSLYIPSSFVTVPDEDVFEYMFTYGIGVRSVPESTTPLFPCEMAVLETNTAIKRMMDLTSQKLCLRLLEPAFHQLKRLLW